MNRLFYKNIFLSLTIAVVGLFTAVAPVMSAEVPRKSSEISGKYLSADLGAADLMGIASKYAAFFWTALIILVICCAGYGLYYLLKKKL